MSIDRRDAVGRDLRRPLTDREWDYLVDEGYIDDAEWAAAAGGATGAAAQIRKITAVVGASRLTNRVEPPPKGWQQQRVRLLARAYSQLAEQAPAVCRLRAQIDGSDLRAALTQMGEPDAARGVPGAPAPAALVVWILDQLHRELRLEPGRDRDALSEAVLDYFSQGEQHAELWFPEDDEARVVSVPVGGLLGEVSKVSAELSARYHWTKWESTRWVVCGGEPPTPAVFQWQAKIRRVGWVDSTTHLVITIDPNLTPAAVAAAYGRARAAILQGSRIRPLEAKAQALAGFALDLAHGPGEPSWEAWRLNWNEGPGQTHGKYRNDGGGPSNFRRDLRSAERRLLRIGWTVPRGPS